MPRRRHEEERSSSSSSPSPRTERRSASSSQTSGRSSSRPSPRPAPATASVAAPASRTPPQAQPASARSQSPRTESSTSNNSYRASSDDRARSDYSYRATNDGENLFGTMIRALICPRPVVVFEVASTPVEAPVAVPVSPCDTQAKAFQDCLHDFETDISKCQFYMNVLSQCKKVSDSKLNSEDTKLEA